MADTGAPWNIPYVAGTDLVRDWPTDSQELAEAVDDALDTVDADAKDASNLNTGTVPTARLPFKIATGQLAVGPGNTGATATFPAGLFTSTPRTVGMVTGTTSGAVPNSVRAVSTSSVTLVHGSGITRDMDYIAIQEV